MNTQTKARDEVPLIGAQAFELDADFSALGIALREILMLRQSRHAFAPGPVPEYRFSRLLWAACGCNRDGAMLRTVPSICGGVAIDLYVANADGLYRFEAARMALVRTLEADLRSREGPGVQDAPAAPLELLYVAHPARMTGVPEDERLWQAALDAGFMAENVSLFCAAEGLATCLQVAPERAALERAMGLQGSERVMLLQRIGIPADAPPRSPWL